MAWGEAPLFAAAAAAAVLAMLAIAAASLIRGIAAALDSIPIPVVGGWISGAFRAIADPVVSWLVGATNELWADAGWWLNAISWSLTQMFDGIKDVLGVHSTQLSYLGDVAVPQSAAAIRREAGAYTSQEIATLNREIAAARTSLANLAAHDSADAWAKAEKLVGSAEHQLTALVASGVRTAEQHADAGIHKLSGELAQEIAGLRAKIGTAPPATVPVEAPPSSVPLPTTGADISTQVGTLTTSVAAIGVSVAALTSEFESCAVTSCAGPNNLANLLKGLLGIADLAAVAAFLQAVISNPVGAEATYSSVIAGLYHGVEQGGTDVWSAIESVIGI